jgi:hypothetical protein
MFVKLDQVFPLGTLSIFFLWLVQRKVNSKMTLLLMFSSSTRWRQCNQYNKKAGNLKLSDASFVGRTGIDKSPHRQTTMCLIKISWDNSVSSSNSYCENEKSERSEPDTFRGSWATYIPLKFAEVTINWEWNGRTLIIILNVRIYSIHYSLYHVLKI